MDFASGITQDTPEYLVKMQDLERTDPDICEEFMQGNVCVETTDRAFTSIDVDHAHEQENRKMKVLGGLTGIVQKTETLARLFSSCA
jgi:hypothetical protein